MKKVTALLLTLLLLFALTVPGFAAEDKVVLTSQALKVDGVQKSCEIYNINGSNYFKLRDIAYLLNGTGSQFSVGYDSATRTATVTSGEAYEPNGTEMVLREDCSDTAKPSTQAIIINGERRDDLDAYNIGGNNFFKLRDLGTALDFGVDYDTASRTMLVTSRSERTELTAEQLYARCMPAVFFIEVYDEYGDAIASGSGFFIDSYGTAVTNHHVIYGADSAKVTLSDSFGKDMETLDVLGVYDWNEEEDWAVLKVDISGNSFLQVGDASSAAGGATVYALGSPLGLSASISDGMISNPARVLDGQTFIQISAPISHGSSGGALVNKYGEVIGITAAGFDEGQNLNLAIPIEAVTTAAHGALTPIAETYVIASGIVYPSSRYVTLQPGETVDNVITAKKYDTDELLTVRYEIEDESVVSCEWDGWGPEDTEVTLYLTAGSGFGSTVVYIYLYTADSEELLDYDYIYVDVAGGTITPNKDYVEIELNDYGIVWIDTRCFDSRTYNVNYSDYNPGLLNYEWGEWEDTDEGHRIPLYMAAIASGSTELRLDMVDYETKEVLATTSVSVTVIGGYLSISDYFLYMLPGETATVTISGEAVAPGQQLVITSDEYPSDVIDWDRGVLSGNPATLTVTAKDIGSDYIIISLLDENGAELNYDYIDVYVEAARLNAAPDALEIKLGESATVQLTATVADGRAVTVVPSEYNRCECVTYALGSWNGRTIPLTVTAQQCGYEWISLDLCDAETGEYLTSCGIEVYVYGGELTISEQEIMLAPGETRTVTISGMSFDSGKSVYIETDEFSSDVIDWQRGVLAGNPAKLTIKGLSEGYDLIIISLYNEDGELINEDQIDVYVNTDGKGADE